MSVLAADEFRLLYAVLLSALVLWASWRFARRWNDDALRAAGDAGLLFYLVQYVSICATGLAGALHPLTIALVALLAGSAMAAIGGRARRRATTEAVDTNPPRAPRESPHATAPAPPGRSPLRALLDAAGPRAAVAAAVAFVVAYLATLVWHQRFLPVLSNDALTYHLPAAAQWLQTGKIAFYEAWFYNPANSYSPLGGSAFLAWLMAPLGNDAVARYVQAGPALLLLVAMINLCRSLGAGLALASLVAATCVLARPFMSQTILAKDDLFVAAFFVLLIDALRRERAAEPFGPWRIGIALGLLLATKYTVLFSLPILLLMLHRRRREGEAPAEPPPSPRRFAGRLALATPSGALWKCVAIAATLAIALAGPWYLRNAWLTGNPLYPTSLRIFGVTIFPGMLKVHRSDLLSSPRGAWDVFTAGYYAMPPLLAVGLIVAWAVAWGISRREAWRDPLRRTCLIGPVLGIALFVAAAPYGEMRFAYPSLALLFGCLAITLARMPIAAQLSVACALMILAAMTAFRIELARSFTIAGVIAAAVVFAAALTRHFSRFVLAGGIAGGALITMAVYVYWPAYLRQIDEDSVVAWSDPGVYGPVGDVWAYVRRELPPGAPLAYANTYFTYPLMGPAYDHRVVHAPTRAGLESFVAMPPIDAKMTGEQITTHVVAMLRENPDREQWLRRLRDTGAEYLVVMKQDPAKPSTVVTPPEAIFAAQDPSRFVRLFDNGAGTVFRINW